jgi:hypothetical protein
MEAETDGARPSRTACRAAATTSSGRLTAIFVVIPESHRLSYREDAGGIGPVHRRGVLATNPCCPASGDPLTPILIGQFIEPTGEARRLARTGSLPRSRSRRGSRSVARRSWPCPMRTPPSAGSQAVSCSSLHRRHHWRMLPFYPVSCHIHACGLGLCLPGGEREPVHRPTGLRGGVRAEIAVAELAAARPSLRPDPARSDFKRWRAPQVGSCCKSPGGHLASCFRLTTACHLCPQRQLARCAKIALGKSGL